MTAHRIATATKLRAAALRIVETEGKSRVVSGIEVRLVRWPSLTIAHTPYMPCYSVTSVRLAQSQGISLDLDAPHLLDIWAVGKHKVFSVRWNDTGLINLVRFNRGEWELLLTV